MAKIEFQNDVTRAQEETAGSDGRLNVSSRADNRGYYNSRDEEQCYTMTYNHPSAADGQYSFYLQNTSTTKSLVVSSIGVNATNTARCKLWAVTGVAGDGIARVPRNLNISSSNDATVNALHDGAGTTISNLSVSGAEIDDIQLSANGHEELRLTDRIRLGQNDAIALELDTGDTTPTVFGVVFFYFE